ncbi:MAG: Histidine kinase-, DNA gyrase B-, and HSP90-like ATPase [Firmicutes bacterium ADurb.Bin354]|nr:MAG: Histidine kinase-, DNA gyrase B-, and HSP90-like ATPase [Firmicutes bacterium ADurb.Bin354]SCX79308.1 Histidine kinase-, DNA gyrase B-, and HSP90-like ATPase [Lachnospiraceae bacterium XPB1003]
MSFSKEKRTRIKKYILEKIFKTQDNYVEATKEAFDVSATTVYKYIEELADEGIISKDNSGKYRLVEFVKEKYDFNNDGTLEEDVIYDKTMSDIVKKLPENAIRIWQYAFMEMVNNAIDHSEADKISIIICQNYLYTWVNIIDNGIGIFNKIAQHYKFKELDEAIIALFKGKLTTDAENHSGEGIFFTSKVMDHFFAVSENKVFSQSNTNEMLTNIKEDYGQKKKGTKIVMALSNNPTQTIKEVFDEYASVDGGFTVSRIPMKKVCDSGYPVSRSQAKRLYFGFEKFKTIILDFKDVEEIGQGFAHELFVVFKRKNPDVELKCVNENSNVSKMIAHVLF